MPALWPWDKITRRSGVCNAGQGAAKSGPWEKSCVLMPKFNMHRLIAKLIPSRIKAALRPAAVLHTHPHLPPQPTPTLHPPCVRNVPSYKSFALPSRRPFVKRNFFLDIAALFTVRPLVHGCAKPWLTASTPGPAAALPAPSALSSAAIPTPASGLRSRSRETAACGSPAASSMPEVGDGMGWDGM